MDATHTGRGGGAVLVDDPPAGGDRVARGRELVAVLELAGLFPARHDATLAFPPFGSARG